MPTPLDTLLGCLRRDEQENNALAAHAGALDPQLLAEVRAAQPTDNAGEQPKALLPQDRAPRAAAELRALAAGLRRDWRAASALLDGNDLHLAVHPLVERLTHHLADAIEAADEAAQRDEILFNHAQQQR